MRTVMRCAALILAFSVLAAGIGMAADGKTIGVAMQGNQSGFVQYMTSGIREWAGKNAPGTKLEIVFADDDAAKQLSQVESLVAKGVDAIILNPVDKVQGATAVEFAAESGVPVITINTITDSDMNAAHVGSDDSEAGYLQMERLIKILGEDAKIAYVDAVLGHSAQVQRTEGYNRSLKEHPGVTLVVHDTGNWSADESMKLVENWLQTGRQIDAIACMADCQLIGVVTAVENAGKLKSIVLSGMDCDPPIMQAIEAGTVDSSIWQDGVGQGENAIRLAIDAANGKEVEDFFLPFEVCTKDNIEYYKKLAVTRDALARKYF